ncbi:hypothetical protein ACFYON_08005 [Micromonospora sp. NPDC005686]|uniref:hypothetical protein n=1 Tax=unclassified Micromonospora TaxID=2617518 RepID=UPI0033AF7AC2
MSLQDELHRELVDLRRRRGLLSASLGRLVGPRLHELSGTTPTDPDRVVRERVGQTLLSLARDLPADLVRVVELTYAIDAEHAYADLTTRQAQLGREQRYELRTARRRSEQVTELLAAAAEADWATRLAGDLDSGWRVRSLEALLRLDTPTPELYEVRTIVATRDLDEIVVRLDLPRPDTDSSDGADLVIDVLYGARIRSVRRGNGNRHFEVRLALPETLSADRNHKLCMHFRVAPGQRIRDRYVITPLDPCDYGLVRVRFAGREPAALWRIDGLPQGLLDDPDRRHDRLSVDGAGDVVAEFRRLRQGRGYGVGWRFAQP